MQQLLLCILAGVCGAFPYDQAFTFWLCFTGMQDIVFLYSFCSCGLILYRKCGTSTSGCVELMNLTSKPIVQTVASVKDSHARTHKKRINVRILHTEDDQ
jgi:hypothetical protein